MTRMTHSPNKWASPGNQWHCYGCSPGMASIKIVTVNRNCCVSLYAACSLDTATPRIARSYTMLVIPNSMGSAIHQVIMLCVVTVCRNRAKLLLTMTKMMRLAVKMGKPFGCIMYNFRRIDNPKDHQKMLGRNRKTKRDLSTDPLVHDVRLPIFSWNKVEGSTEFIVRFATK